MPRLHALIAALSLFLAISYAQCMTWQSCEGSNSALNITSVSMQPDTPTHGQAMAFTVEAESDNDQAIGSGQLHLSVSWHGWHVYGETLDLCTSTACPIQRGHVTIANQHQLPSIAPPGAYSIRLEASGDGAVVKLAGSSARQQAGAVSRRMLGLVGEQQQLMCIDMFFDIQGSD